MENNKISRKIIVGGGDLGRELISWMINSNHYLFSDENIFYIDDNIENEITASSKTIKCIGSIQDFIAKKDDEIYMAISNPITKKSVYQLLKSRDVFFSSYIHPTSLISRSAKIGEGCILFPYSICSENSNLEKLISINVHSSIGHDTKISSFCTISSHVDLMGRAEIKEQVFLGSGARVLPKVKIEEKCIIGAGATIIKSLKAEKTAYTTPAKLL
tara:strand:+ start:5128 stop:5775 length:648 start_codon:yes stop_codon:yes gene_type:complete